MLARSVAPHPRYDHQMKRADVYAEPHGPAASPTIVLVHGAPDRSAGFRAVLSHCIDRHVVTYDRRGYGRSLYAPPARAMIDHAEDLLAIVQECRAPPVVVAHSFGSNPTMLAATLNPTVFGAIGLWEPPLPWVEWWPERTKAYNARVAASSEPADEVEAMYRSLLGQAWDDLPPEVQSQRRAEGAAFQVDMASEIDAPFEFHEVLVPALVGYGTATSAEHVEGARWLADQLPNGRVRASPGAGHFAPRTHPREFAAFIAAAMELENERQSDSPG